MFRRNIIRRVFFFYLQIYNNNMKLCYTGRQYIRNLSIPMQIFKCLPIRILFCLNVYYFGFSHQTIPTYIIIHILEN